MSNVTIRKVITLIAFEIEFVKSFSVKIKMNGMDKNT